MGNGSPTSTTMEQYREAKNQYLKLNNQVKKGLVARFNVLAAQLLQVQRELLEDFGEKVSLPTKASIVKKPKPAAASSAPAATSPSPANTAKAASLTKQLEKQKKKLDELKAAGKPTKVISAPVCGPLRRRR